MLAVPRGAQSPQEDMFPCRVFSRNSCHFKEQSWPFPQGSRGAAPPGPLPSSLLLCALRAGSSRWAGQWRHCQSSEGRSQLGVLCLGHHGQVPPATASFTQSPASHALGPAPALALQCPLAVAGSQRPRSVLRSRVFVLSVSCWPWPVPRDGEGTAGSSL